MNTKNQNITQKLQHANVKTTTTKQPKDQERRVPTLCFNSILLLRAPFRRVIAADVEEGEQQMVLLM